MLSAFSEGTTESYETSQMRLELLRRMYEGGAGMKCPHCGKSLKELMQKIGSKGGSKSRRTLTPEQARAMVAAREAKKKDVKS